MGARGFGRWPLSFTVLLPTDCSGSLRGVRGWSSMVCRRVCEGIPWGDDPRSTDGSGDCTGSFPASVRCAGDNHLSRLCATRMHPVSCESASLSLATLFPTDCPGSLQGAGDGPAWSAIAYAGESRGGTRVAAGGRSGKHTSECGEYRCEPCQPGAMPPPLCSDKSPTH